ncbi:hypothetical protein [Streptomyces sp. SudanB52_2052]|uniref:hypothetical protein n=1 Tax=Streptomyces sp. SudanB52_2052 TaxID=3035276 RepID=UPI003F547515
MGLPSSMTLDEMLAALTQIKDDPRYQGGEVTSYAVCPEPFAGYTITKVQPTPSGTELEVAITLTNMVEDDKQKLAEAYAKPA